jgi:enoyl-CoA hydratase/3-hydroxyacyl-CoA dehydrogenase
MAGKDVEQIAVIGAGTMGHGIAQVAALKGFKAILTDVSEEILARALERIRWSLGKLAEKGLIRVDEIDEVLGRIRLTTSLEEAVSESDIVIEAVFEDVSVKKEVLRRVDHSAPKAALIASNTSSIPINELASALSRPDRFLGMHFFNPPQLNELVEIIVGRETSHEAREAAISLAKRLGKSPVIVRKDVPGFIVNRVMVRMLEAASHLVETGRYSVEAIDSAMIYRLGFPMGAFELADYVGLDILLGIMRVISARDPTLKIVRIVEEKVLRGEIGAKAQRGFYSYSGKIYERPKISPSLGASVDPALLVAPVLNEAARLIDDGVVSREDVETALRLGLNLSKPIFQYLENLDSTRIREALRIYEKELGPAYAPSPILLELQKTPPNRGEIGEISIVRETPIGWIMLNRPHRLNTLTLKMLEEIETAVRELDKDSAIRVIVLKGLGGRAFSAGADITMFKDLLAGEEDKAAKAREISEKFHCAAHTIESCQKPVIAAIDGYALGGGLELALACDLRIASDRSELGLPEINLGMIPGGGGTQRLVRLVGPAKASEMILTGERVKAEEAHRIGLVNITIPKESFDNEVKAYALKLAEKPPLALRAAKLALRSAQETHIREGLAMEKLLFGELFNTQDLIEGVSAFLSKRRPEFKGK